MHCFGVRGVGDWGDGEGGFVGAGCAGDGVGQPGGPGVCGADGASAGRLAGIGGSSKFNFQLRLKFTSI